MLLIQEHKLRLTQVENLGRYLWGQAKSWIVDASSGYNNRVMDPGVGCGGIAIFLASKWSKLVDETGSILDNRAQYVILRGLTGGDTGFLNIYTLNESTMQIRLWKELLHHLPLNCCWIMCSASTSSNNAKIRQTHVAK